MMQLDPTALALARTHSYGLGQPRSMTPAPDGRYLYFIRSETGGSSLHSLWRLDIHAGSEELVFDPAGHGGTETLTLEEEQQRERLRETSSGVTSYILSTDGSKLCFSLHGELWLTDTVSLESRVFTHVSGAFDPRFSPDGSQISFVTGEGLWTIPADTKAEPVSIVKNESDHIFWGRAEFIASEEFERYRGHWWAPDNKRIVAARVDETAVQDSFPLSSDAWKAPEAYKYPAAGTANAEATLAIFDPASGSRTPITWDIASLPYLLNVQWRKAGLFVTAQSRDQRTITLLSVRDDGTTEEVSSAHDDIWLDIVQPLPYVSDEGRMVSLSQGEKRGLVFDGTLVTPEDHHVDDFLGLFQDWMVYVASPDPKERVVFAADPVSRKVIQLSPSGGLFGAAMSEQLLYVTGTVMGEHSRRHFVFDDIEAEPSVVSIASNSDEPSHWPDPLFFTVGPHKIEVSLVLPRDYKKDTPLPVLIQTYGGPHHQEVLYSARSYLESQWWADQGFAVLSADGPGTPGRDSAWERQIHGDFITAPAAAQIEALHEALARFDFLDKSRVAVRGWSFGGYLSAYLSILYPGDIQASISGAPVTDWHLYDTHYTERYLGHPGADKKAYHVSSLIDAAATATRPILLIHGLQDDNVLPANSLKLLQALSAAHAPYQFIPLDGASHFTKEAEQRSWLLEMELRFLQTSMARQGA